ncbi:nucleoside-diphosphate-sugar epimerase [Actinoplanes campanulatus]|uniref:Nucleoside-diphosphate-sugar epimerase n=1 Tax=Actinoplanes campanulatus TaxID=113559 RepID=A0A7W5ADB0_9ACTN|nr:NAD-dependent epimerase/dehydratase family protein [Actinoplanes campanulatus]MBB3094056.1 nucleoside-diphosphate-sugar epimerase [Actinoplanes campanulatus]GGN33073.1 dTDP-4-dehydrorhamnose 3,5-epimerase [Actinoplanes campanulatus]
MKVLVTGASGFLGGHLAEAAVAAGDDVRALLRPGATLSMDVGAHRVEPASGDLSDPASLDAATREVEVVYHSAARVTDHGTRAQFHDTNIAGTERLLAAARANGVRRFVFVSSPSAVMDGGDQVAIDESTPYPARYLNLYSETKAAAERLVLAANAPGFTTCALRPRGIWGPRDWFGFMPRLIAKLRTGRLPDLSGGRAVHASLCHATSAARACLLAAGSDRVGGRAYFVTDAEITDVWALIAQVARLFDAAPPTRRVPPAVRDALVATVETVWRIPYLRHRHSPPLSRYSVALLTRSSTYDTSAATRDFGYAPVIDQQTGLRQLRAWADGIGGVDAFTRHVR